MTHFCDVITDASKLQVCIFGRLCHSAIIENIISCYAFSTKKAFYCKDRTFWMHYIDQELLQSEHIKAISQSIVICTLTALSLMAVVYADPCVTYWKAKIYYFPDTHQTWKVFNTFDSLTNIIILIACLYFYIYSLSFLLDSFCILGGKSIGALFLTLKC